MKPISSSNPIPCGTPTTSDCSTWVGGNLVCLGIENGQTISVVVKNVAEQVCELMQTLDLSDLDLKCAFDLCLSCPEPEKTLGVVLQLLIDKVCTIDEAISNLSTSTESSTDPILSLASCFQYTNTEGDLIVELPHSTYTRRIANEVCSVLLRLSEVEDDIQSLQDDVNSLQEQINAIDTNIPNVSSDCLFVGTRSIDDAWDLIDQAFCQLRASVGLTTDINTALSRLCSDLNSEYSATPGWILSPQNLAQGINNLMIAFCDVRSRVNTIENTCCAFDCSDVMVGFSARINDDGDGIILRFTSGNGTSIPTGFADIGSTVTITDALGNVEEFNITIANNATEELIVTEIDLNTTLDISITAKIGDGSTSCEKCVSKTLKISGTCDYCEISASGSDPDAYVVITYEGDFTSITIPDTTTTTSTTTTTTVIP